MKVAVTGSSGLIGTALVAGLRADGHEVLRLVRGAPAGQDTVTWDPRAERGGLDPGSLDGVTAVVHLASAGVADKRWTPSYRAEIRDSRVNGTKALVRAVAAMTTPPGVLLAGSAIGWYGDTGGREVTEASPAGRGFLAEVVREWEAAAGEAAAAGIRVCTLRSGLVLSPRGGILGRLLPLFRLGLGGRPAADQPDHLVAVRTQRGDEGCADQSRGAGDRDFHQGMSPRSSSLLRVHRTGASLRCGRRP